MAAVGMYDVVGGGTQSYSVVCCSFTLTTVLKLCFSRQNPASLLHCHTHEHCTYARGTYNAGKALDMAAFSLQQMAAGGMYDVVGGGFHRYSVDEHWHIPHFEKMLYDNPQLACTYLDAFAVTKDQSYAEVARGILDYLRRDMTHPLGGIFSAEVLLLIM